MWPELNVVVGGYHVVLSNHALLVLIGTMLGTYVATRPARLPIGVVLLTVGAVALGGLYGARLLYVLQRGGPVRGVAGGMASFGGIAVGIALIMLIARVTLVRAADLFDAISPAFLVAFGCGRLGCFLGGCCAGAVTGMPWAVVFPALGPAPRHPLQVYSALFDFALAWWAIRRGGRPGLVAVRCAAGLGFGRVLLETLRDPTATDLLWSGGISVPQLCGLLLGLGAVWLGRGLARKPMLASSA